MNRFSMTPVLPSALPRISTKAAAARPRASVTGGTGERRPLLNPGTAFGCPRDFQGHRFVYVVLSSRARGLSVGLNLNPDQQCNFDCIYCEVTRRIPPSTVSLDVSAMAEELDVTLRSVRDGGLSRRPCYAGVNPELLVLRQVALSGDGEPTLCPRFLEVVQTVVHARACSGLPFFKIVLVTNGTGLDVPPVEEGLRHFTTQDEVWVKLDAGTQAYMDRVNRATMPLEEILGKILKFGRRRPVVIQSLFARINGVDPGDDEITAYLARLLALKSSGCRIKLVQIYSATRPTPHSECQHLPLRELTKICRRVREVTGLESEVY